MILLPYFKMRTTEAPGYQVGLFPYSELVLSQLLVEVLTLLVPKNPRDQFSDLHIMMAFGPIRCQKDTQEMNNSIIDTGCYSSIFKHGGKSINNFAFWRFRCRKRKAVISNKYLNQSLHHF